MSVHETPPEQVMQLDNGYLLVLDREQAKAFFGIREEHACVEFLTRQLEQAAAPTVDCLGHWQALHDSLSRLDGGDSVLEQCILGGRPMHEGDHRIALVRPDVVRAVARQLADINESAFRATFPPGAPGDVDAGWGLCAKIAELYTRATELGGAVVFVVKKART